MRKLRGKAHSNNSETFFVARPFFAPQLGVDERGGRTDQVSAWIANLPDDGRMDRLWKDLIDGSIADKSYCVPGPGLR